MNPTIDNLVRDRKIIAEQITVDSVPAFVIWWSIDRGVLVCHGFEPLNECMPICAVKAALAEFAKRENVLLLE